MALDQDKLDGIIGRFIRYRNTEISNIRNEIEQAYREGFNDGVLFQKAEDSWKDNWMNT